MSYDIYLNEPDGDVCQLEKHGITGGTSQMGGTNDAWLNVTYNYAKHFYKHVDSEKGIRWLYGKTGKETIARLNLAIDELGQDESDDYWEATEGNARKALLGLRAFAVARPDGVWGGD